MHHRIPSDMTPDEYRAALVALNLNPHTSAEALGLSQSLAYRYPHGRSPIPMTVAKLLRALIKLGTTEV